MGKLPPDTVKPVPEIESELMLTATLPLEVNVTDFVTAVPTDTFPNASDAVLRLRAGTAAFKLIAKLLEEAFAVAVRAAVCVVLTEDTFAVNEAVEAPAATLTLVGTVTALVLLESAMLWPVESAAMLSETVQLVDPVPVNELLPHVRELMEGAMVEEDPLSLMDVILVVDPCEAVRVTLCDVLTAATVAVNGALFAPEGTVTDPGTAIALLLLARLTTNPVLGATAVKVTVQLSIPAPLIEVLEQRRPESEAVPEFDPFPCSLIVLDDFDVVLEVLMVVRLTVPVESTAVLGSYWTFTDRLCPARRVAGNLVELTVNAPVEPLRSTICTLELPEFVMEMSFAATVPTFTSPKSTDEGVTTTEFASEAPDENTRELDPHPDSPRLNRMENTSAVTVTALYPCKRSIVSELDGRTARISLASKNEKLRISLIRRHLHQSQSVLRSADAENPAEPAAGEYNLAASFDYQQNRPSGGMGTGDDSHECGMYWVPLY